MASFTLTRPDVFPSGTVTAYVAGPFDPPNSGVPSGASAASGTVTGGSVTFSGLADSTRYIAYQGSPDRYIAFKTPPVSATTAVTSLAENKRALWLPSGAIDQTITRDTIGSAAVTIFSGTLALAGGLVIPAGRVVSSITFLSATTAAVTPTNQWFCLVDRSLNVLAKTVDDTTTAWAVNVFKTLALSAPYTPSVDTAVYAGIVVVAATVPNLKGNSTTAGINGVAPILAGSSTVGLTNPASLGATAGAITATGTLAYAYIS